MDIGTTITLFNNGVKFSGAVKRIQTPGDYFRIARHADKGWDKANAPVHIDQHQFGLVGVHIVDGGQRKPFVKDFAYRVDTALVHCDRTATAVLYPCAKIEQGDLHLNRANSPENSTNRTLRLAPLTGCKRGRSAFCGSPGRPAPEGSTQGHTVGNSRVSSLYFTRSISRPGGGYAFIWGTTDYDRIDLGGML